MTRGGTGASQAHGEEWQGKEPGDEEAKGEESFQTPQPGNRAVATERSGLKNHWERCWQAALKSGQQSQSRVAELK